MKFKTWSREHDWYSPGRKYCNNISNSQFRQSFISVPCQFPVPCTLVPFSQCRNSWMPVPSYRLGLIHCWYAVNRLCIFLQVDWPEPDKTGKVNRDWWDGICRLVSCSRFCLCIFKLQFACVSWKSLPHDIRRLLLSALNELCLSWSLVSLNLNIVSSSD